VQFNYKTVLSQVTHNGTTTEIDAASFQWPVDSHLINASIDGKKKILQYLDHLPLGFRLVHYGTRYDIQFYSPEAFKLLQNFPEKPKTDFSKVPFPPKRKQGTLIEKLWIR